ncbi:glycerol-3-phosphate dehydrogenase/oxidase [Cohnella sp. GCM10027633]|uniref:glycerol-3-phosphate dehydrogenase/oxidase n=1 Tax=unclassified Cohnella TaxID=2636738 RepID=UPI003628F002
MADMEYAEAIIRDGGLSASRRAERLAKMAEGPIDLLVVGGGITGAGIALDAATRGLRVALVEMQDYAAGTSSRSTKLVHGGLRYLKQLEFGVVAEVGKERAIVYENGPHVTTPEWMLLPFYKGGTFGPLSTSLGLRVYDFLAGVRKSERRRMLSAEEAAKREPLLKREGLRGGGYYVEYRTDDARLTLEVMKKAAESGALTVNYAAAESFLYEGGKLVGAVVRDRVGGGAYAVKATTVVNAAGPWVDELRELDRSKRGKTLRLTKGVHLVFDRARFPLGQAIYFDAPDGRMLFAIPRDGKTYFGTTDTVYEADIANPRMTGEDRRYLLDAANRMFPGLGLTAADAESSWAGLRPLVYQEGKSPSDISRRDEIFESASGLISIAGGKLTGYRRMAETVVDRVGRRLRAAGGPIVGASRTKRLPISGGDVGGSARFEAYVGEQRAEGIRGGLDAAEAVRLARQYGSNAPKLFAIAAEGGAARSLSARHGLPLDLAAELVYAIAEESAIAPVDFWIRRTGRLFFDIAYVRQWRDALHSAMGELLGWSEEEGDAHREGLERALAEASGA